MRGRASTFSYIIWWQTLPQVNTHTHTSSWVITGERLRQAVGEGRKWKEKRCWLNCKQQKFKLHSHHIKKTPFFPISDESMNDQLCALMPLEHIKHVWKPLHAWSPIYVRIISNWERADAFFFLRRRQWYTTSDDGRRRRSGAPQNRCHERLRVKGQEEGKYDREWGERRVRSMNEWALLFWHGDRT